MQHKSLYKSTLIIALLTLVSCAKHTKPVTANSEAAVVNKKVVVDEEMVVPEQIIPERINEPQVIESPTYPEGSLQKIKSSTMSITGGVCCYTSYTTTISLYSPSSDSNISIQSINGYMVNLIPTQNFNDTLRIVIKSTKSEIPEVSPLTYSSSIAIWNMQNKKCSTEETIIFKESIGFTKFMAWPLTILYKEGEELKQLVLSKPDSSSEQFAP